MKKLIAFLFFVLLFAGGFLFSKLNALAFTGELQENWNCQSSGPQCGTNNGTEYVCPEGYERYGNTCKKWVEVVTYDCDIYVDIHGNNHNLKDYYNKPTGDDKHCHRIVWDNLSWQAQWQFKNWHDWDYNYSSPNHGNWISAYNSHVDENPLADKDTEGSWGYTDKVSQSCTAGEPRYDSCDSAGECSDKCGIEEPYEVPDGKGGFIPCGTTPACVVDQCDNLPEFQETVPEGYVQERTEEGLICTPEPTVTPEPPTVQSHGEPGAPQCGDGAILALPLNVLVVRAGANATVKWIPTGGNLVNIYILDGKGELVGAEGDIPNDGEEVIEHLNPTGDYTFELEQHQGCGGGQRARVGVVDSYLPMTFFASYWKWSN